jgi:hypothetical protein
MKKKLIALAVAILSLASIYGTYSYLSTPAVADNVLKFVSGTEYQALEDGQTVIRLMDSKGIGVTADSCNVTIWYPDKTLFVDNEAMVSGGADGSWYKNWTTPATTGVYEEYASCIKGAKTYGTSSSFHVSQALTALNQTLDEPHLVIVS